MSELSVSHRTSGAVGTIPLRIVDVAPQPDIPICAKCASIRKTCCQRAEVVVTDEDIKRVHAFSGQVGFWENLTPTDPAYVDYDGDPVWARGTIEDDGTRRVLKRRANGDCTFLTDVGCSLPMDIRPLVCRLYPFAYTEAGIDGINDDYCPQQLIPDGKTMVDLLDMNMIEARHWHRLLYEELRSRVARRGATLDDPK